MASTSMTVHVQPNGLRFSAYAVKGSSGSRDFDVIGVHWAEGKDGNEIKFFCDGTGDAGDILADACREYLARFDEQCRAEEAHDGTQN